MENYRDEMEKIVSEVKALAFDCKTWSLRKSTPRLNFSSTNVPYSKNPVFRAETTFNMDIEKLRKLIDPVHPIRLKWDPFPESFEILKTLDFISKDTCVLYSVIKPLFMGIIKRRDTIDLVQFKTTEDYTYVIFASIHYTGEIPKKSDYVRGWDYPSGLFLIPTDNPNVTKSVMILNVDMRIQLLNVTVTIPQLILENYLMSKMCHYAKCLEEAKRLI